MNDKDGDVEQLRQELLEAKRELARLRTVAGAESVLAEDLQQRFAPGGSVGFLILAANYERAAFVRFVVSGETWHHVRLRRDDVLARQFFEPAAVTLIDRLVPRSDNAPMGDIQWNDFANVYPVQFEGKDSPLPRAVRFSGPAARVGDPVRVQLLGGLVGEVDCVITAIVSSVIHVRRTP